MKLELMSLASGSKGNCVVLSDGECSVMIDAGLTYADYCGRIADSPLVAAKIQGVLMTHCHTDHTRGIKALCEHLQTEVYVHRRGLCSVAGYARMKEERFVCYDAPFEIGSMRIEGVEVSHDVPYCNGYVILCGGVKLAYFTDLGYVSEGVRQAICGADMLFLESNHDEEMLKKGSYPYSLKRRILSERGHLSNEAAAHTALFAVQNGTRHIVLGHLSEENNLPELAYDTTNRLLARHGFREGRDFTLEIAAQRAAGRPLSVDD